MTSGIRQQMSFRWSVVCSVLIVFAMAPGAQARSDFSPDSTYYVTVGKNCQKAGTPACGNLTIGRDRLPSGNKVVVSMYHQVCLGNVPGGAYRRVTSPVIRTSGNRFYIKIDRPRIKLKLRGRFVAAWPGSTEVKGTLSFRNLNRDCGFRPFGFRQVESGTTTDPQG